MIKYSSTEFHKSQELIENCLKEANTIKAVFPYSYLYFPNLINEIVKKGVDIEVFLHKNIFKPIEKC